jgi:transcriptional regulator with GAF, ATPase, and Fis domain
VVLQALERQLEDSKRTMADTEAARESQRQEWEAKCKGMQEDSKAMENSWKSKVGLNCG